MNTLLADPPGASHSGEPLTGEPPGELKPADEPDTPHGSRQCASCGAPMQAGQDWCLQCGAASPGSLGATPGWRSGAAVTAAVVILAAGAAAASYAALNKKAAKAPVKPATVAFARTSTQPAPASTAPSSGAPATTPPAGAAAKATGAPAKPPALPAVSSTPEAAAPSTPETAPPTPSTPSEKESSAAGSSGSKAESSESSSSAGSSGKAGESSSSSVQPTPILLDTNAAANYNPYHYPASSFGDPRLAIDGDATTAWTTKVNPAVAPKMAQGLVIDLKAAMPVAKLSLLTATPGITVQVYGANTKTVPSSLSAPGWHALASSHLIKGRKGQIKLEHSSQSFRFILLWFVKAPEANSSSSSTTTTSSASTTTTTTSTTTSPSSSTSTSTAAPPSVYLGQVDLNELVLYAPK